MIQIPVDEAYALDYLAILAVKLENGLDVRTEIESFSEALRAQIPGLPSILASDEYRELLGANRGTFLAIELAAKDRIKASAVQEVNRKRFLMKQALQRTFWGSPLLEQKQT